MHLCRFFCRFCRLFCRYLSGSHFIHGFSVGINQAQYPLFCAILPPFVDVQVHVGIVAERVGEQALLAMELALELAEPFALASGKNLLVTVVFDAEDDDNCTMGSDYAPFYTSGIRRQAMVYTNNWTSFVDYAQGEDFPDATAMLGCGTNVELPVTLINYSFEKSTGVEEIEAAKTEDNVYYNLMGQKFDGNNLPAGIYIHNGQKIIIR